jgi:hypothetical protein
LRQKLLDKIELEKTLFNSANTIIDEKIKYQRLYQDTLKELDKSEEKYEILYNANSQLVELIKNIDHSIENFKFSKSRKSLRRELLAIE